MSLLQWKQFHCRRQFLMECPKRRHLTQWFAWVTAVVLCFSDIDLNFSQSRVKWFSSGHTAHRALDGSDTRFSGLGLTVRVDRFVCWFVAGFFSGFEGLGGTMVLGLVSKVLVLVFTEKSRKAGFETSATYSSSNWMNSPRLMGLFSRWSLV